jgi:hypothetical protein
MKKILVLSVILALVLSLVLPTVAMASKPVANFSASGIMNSIDTGTVREIGDTGLWKVKNRHIKGSFPQDDDLGVADFIITYDGVFNIADQSGEMKGKMETGRNTLKITGTVEPYTLVDASAYGYQYLPKLVINGEWSGQRGVKAKGTFEAWMIFVPDAEGHVLAIVDSAFDMTGKYTKK